MEEEAHAITSRKAGLTVEDVSKRFLSWASPRQRLIGGVLGASSRHPPEENWALRNVSFTAEPGHTYGVVGRNGSGKSTLLKIVCGVMRPTTGRTVTHGRVLGLLELGAGLNPDLTGRRNVEVSSAMLGFPADYARVRMGDIEAFADIGEFFDAPMKFYSSGMFVRLAFSLYLFLEPDILIIDEALSVGDHFFQQKCAEAMNRIRERGATLLFVSHSLGTVKAICDRAIALDRGEVVAEGDVDEVVRAYLAQDRDADPSAPAHAPSAARLRNAASVVSELSGGGLPVTAPAGWQVLGARLVDPSGAPTSLFQMRAGAEIEVALAGPPDAPLPKIQIDLLDRFDRVVSGAVFDPADASRVPFGAAEAAAFVVAMPMEVEPGAYTVEVALPDAGGPLRSLAFRTEVAHVYNRRPHPDFYCIANVPARFEASRI